MSGCSEIKGIIINFDGLAWFSFINYTLATCITIYFLLVLNYEFTCVAVEVRKRTLYRQLILRKWRLKFRTIFDVIVDVVLDCFLYACKALNENSAHLCFMCVQRCIV